MADVLCLGEILVDWVCTTVGADLDRAQAFTKAAGGAPANTAVGLARQGISTGFIGRVSDDEFGRWLKSILEKDNIDCSCVVVDPEAQTRMAYVVTTASGDRKLAEFTKIACADARLEPGDLKDKAFESASVIHFGSISLISSPAREATQRAVELAKKNNMLVSYDPNVRLGLWASPEICRQTILDTLRWADVCKINEDELAFLTGSRSLDAAEKLRSEHDIGLFIVTLDSRGAFFAHRNGSMTVPGFHVVLVEATGAGDGFNSGVITGLLETAKTAPDRVKALNDLTCAEIEKIIRSANAIGALTCTRPGAIPALPTRAESTEFLDQMASQSKTFSSIAE
jgi:sugar/nucleoside kinase (ribokinase family)